VLSECAYFWNDVEKKFKKTQKRNCVPFLLLIDVFYGTTFRYFVKRSMRRAQELHAQKVYFVQAGNAISVLMEVS